MTKPRHRWVLQSGDFRAIPPSAVEKCAYCAVLTKTVVLKTSVTRRDSAEIRWTPTPVYSVDGEKWSYAKPVCTGKVAATA